MNIATGEIVNINIDLLNDFLDPPSSEPDLVDAGLKRQMRKLFAYQPPVRVVGSGGIAGTNGTSDSWSSLKDFYYNWLLPNKVLVYIALGFAIWYWWKYYYVPTQKVPAHSNTSVVDNSQAAMARVVKQQVSRSLSGAIAGIEVQIDPNDFAWASSRPSFTDIHQMPRKIMRY